jgi:hypothetical protein
MSGQLTDKLIMIRPKHFSFNPETAVNNKFQKRSTHLEEKQIRNQGIQEFDRMVIELQNHHIGVVVYDDGHSGSPDAVFPNNWITTHDDGSVYTFPLYSPMRRKERREDILASLAENHFISNRYCLEYFEIQNQFLEGTGSMILDREYKIAYACLSPRTDVRVLHKFSLLSGFKIIHFKAKDLEGHDIYHTNVLMTLGLDFSIICMDAVENENRDLLERSFVETGKELIQITFDQMSKFAGNMLEVKNVLGKRYLVLSRTAFDSLTQTQIATLRQRTEFIIVTIPTIESIGGGSARCMIVENFLPPKQLFN